MLTPYLLKRLKSYKIKSNSCSNYSLGNIKPLFIFDLDLIPAGELHLVILAIVRGIVISHSVLVVIAKVVVILVYRVHIEHVLVVVVVVVLVVVEAVRWLLWLRVLCLHLKVVFDVNKGGIIFVENHLKSHLIIQNRKSIKIFNGKQGTYHIVKGHNRRYLAFDIDFLDVPKLLEKASYILLF